MSQSSSRLFSLTALLTAALGFSAASALHAAPINYGNFAGTSFTYLQVTEDSSTDATPFITNPLFGAPTITGNAISFNPVSFGSNSTGGAFDITDGTLASTIISTVPGVGIDKVVFSEAGDYTLAGTGTSATSATVSAALFVKVTQTDAGPIAPISFSTNLTFGPSGGTYDLINDPGILSLWSGSGQIDITALLLSHGITNLATRVEFTLDNQLITFSQSGTIAYIKKKQAGGVTLEVVGGGVPEPASLALFAAGGLVLLRRRRA